MNNKAFYKLFTIILILSCTIPQFTYAQKWEDSDSPISFKIEMLAWDDANKIIPNKAKFSVIDVETGLYFHVQRRAGNRHADVQPLTVKDTKIMKKIYNGKWSWKRRAIIVLIHDQMIAASMHGMPHGAGALQNDFPGHFCIHFYGSTTHRLRNEDFSHKLMILKAAGKIDEYVSTINPNELINVFVSSINQDDQKMLKMTLSNYGNSKKIDGIVKNITQIKVTIYSTPPPEDIDEMVLVKIPVKINMYTKENGQQKRKGMFVIKRDNLTHQWLIDQESVYKCLQ